MKPDNVTWLERWFFERVLADSPTPPRYPMHARLADGTPCPLPWSAVLGSGVRHEGWNERRFRESFERAWEGAK